MASPATHILLANKVFNKFFKDKNRKDFFIGTSLPDIRYFGVINRDKTHFKNISLNNLRKENSFFAGLKFHSIVDEIGRNYLISENIDSLCPELKHKTKLIKTLQDRLFYGFINNWNEYINFFNEILSDEIKMGIKKTDLQKWHSILQKYLSKKPDYQSMMDFSLALGFTEKVIDEWEKNIQQIQYNKKIIQIAKNFYQDFDLLLENYFNKN